MHKKKIQKKKIHKRKIREKIKRLTSAVTLIELVVVMAILGILSMIGIAQYLSSQTKAKDAQRKSDLTNIAKALEMYYNDNQRYPPSEDGKVAGINWGESFTDESGQIVYMKELPQDPSGDYEYYYESDEAGSYYKLYARLENPRDPSLVETGYVVASLVEEDKAYNFCISSPNVICQPQTAAGSLPTSTPALPTPTNTPTPAVSYDCVYYSCTTEQSGCFTSDPCPAGDITCGHACVDDPNSWCVGAYDYGEAMCSGGEHFYSWFECTLYPGQGDGESLWCSSEPEGWDGVYYLTPTPTPTPTSKPTPTPTPTPTSTPTPVPSNCWGINGHCDSGCDTASFGNWAVYSNSSCSGEYEKKYYKIVTPCSSDGSGVCYKLGDGGTWYKKDYSGACEAGVYYDTITSCVWFP